MADEKSGASPYSAVYVSSATFKNAIENLSHGIPNVIDRSAFPGQSWGVQAQLLAGLKFLGLTTDDGKPTPSLHELAVPDEAIRKKKLETIIRERYARLFALDLMKTTPVELERQMAESYNVTGDTREKAIRFFLSMVDYLEIPVSRFLKPKSIGNGTPTPRRRRASTPRQRATEEPGEEEPSTVAPGGTSKTVKLKSGGTLTVAASLDLFSLSDEDRTFVFELIDKLKKYQPESQERG